MEYDSLYDAIKILPNSLIRHFETKNKNSSKLAKEMLSNKITVWSGFQPIEFSKEFNWDMVNEKNIKSFQLYLQSLRYLNDLITEFYENPHETTLEKIHEISYSWIIYSENNPENEMIWYDHPTAIRAQILIQFMFIVIKNNINIELKKYFESLEKHIDVLSDFSNYNYNNHGLMMDRSLLLLGVFLNRENLIFKGVSRSTEAFWYNYSPNGIHLENSPEYHLMVTKLYKNTQKYLELSDYSYSDYILRYLKKADEYFDILVRPDGYLPAFGDSAEIKYSLDNKIYKNLNDKESGMNIYQRSVTKPLYLTFISGYSSRVHKHLDDLSLTLNYNFKNYFVDPGKFNYSSSPIRKYVMRETSHSAIYFKKYKYKRTNENRFTRKVRTNGYYHGENYSIISGINESFNGNKYIERKVIIFNEYDVIIILDKCHSDRETSIVQNFNLHQDIIVKKETDKAILRNRGETIVIEQFSKSNMKLIRGENEEVIAKNTIKSGKMIDTKQIQFIKNTSLDNYDFITAINMDNYILNIYEMENQIINVDIDNTKYIINT